MFVPSSRLSDADLLARIESDACWASAPEVSNKIASPIMSAIFIFFYLPAVYLIVFISFINCVSLSGVMDRKFDKCEICGASIPSEGDAPLYCKDCIEQMEQLNISPPKYRKYRELKETLKKK
jgi:tRNA(Ile2) C34 agmatinyltransferase TiaS